jgi:hypothetical protein
VQAVPRGSPEAGGGPRSPHPHRPPVVYVFRSPVLFSARSQHTRWPDMVWCVCRPLERFSAITHSTSSVAGPFRFLLLFPQCPFRCCSTYWCGNWRQTAQCHQALVPPLVHGRGHVACNTTCISTSVDPITAGDKMALACVGAGTARNTGAGRHSGTGVGRVPLPRCYLAKTYCLTPQVF